MHRSTVADIAREAGYPPAAIEAAIEHHARRTRLKHPPGRFDKAGRFHAEERTEKVSAVRSPSRAWPLSEQKAARTAEHCAEVYDVEPLYVKRIAKALNIDLDSAESCHETLERLAEIRRILKPVKS